MTQVHLTLSVTQALRLHGEALRHANERAIALRRIADQHEAGLADDDLLATLRDASEEANAILRALTDALGWDSNTEFSPAYWAKDLSESEYRAMWGDR
jgi:hypothetical protein